MNKDKIHPLEILPVKMENTGVKFNLPAPLPNDFFTMCLLAPSKSGKSYYIVNVLYRFLKPLYQQIYYISPNIYMDRTLKKNVAIDDEIIKIYEEEDLKNIDDMLKIILDEQKDKEEKDRDNILIILDDMIEYFKNHTILDSLPSYSRHNSISFIVTSQVFTAIPRRMRINASNYVIFRIFNTDDLDTIIKEVGKNFKNFKKYYKECTKEPYSFMTLDNREMTIYKKMTKKLWEKNNDESSDEEEEEKPKKTKKNNPDK